MNAIFKTSVRRVCAFVCTAGICAAASAAGDETLKVTGTKRDGRVAAGTVALPASHLDCHRWQIVSGSLVGDAVGQLTFGILEAEREKLMETLSPESFARQYAMEQQLKLGCWKGYSWWGSLKDFAEKHDGQIDPETIKKIAAEELSPYDGQKDAKGPFWAVVPGVTFQFEEVKPNQHYRRVLNNEVILVELRPLYDDGHHWVGRTDRGMHREPIDQALMTKHGFDVRPLLPRAEMQAPPEALAYNVAGLYNAAGTVRFIVTNSISGASRICEWNIGAETPEESPGLLVQWAQERATSWRSAVGIGEYAVTPLYLAWDTANTRAFLAKESVDHTINWNALSRRRRWDNTDGSVTAFGLLGGFAALQETLQMQVWRGEEHAAPRTVALADIPGVEVKSHPYAEMLGGDPGGRLALADAVPEDRFFVYAAKPESLLALLNSGAEFFTHAGEMATGRALRYDLEKRYLARLGMDRGMLENILRMKLVSEIAVFMPDLFLIDGTDITVVCRVPQIASFTAALKLMGLEAGAAAPVAVKTASGATVHAVVDGDLVILGTRESEVTAALALARDANAKSLGRSAEFRYMLTQLPVQETTRLYAYFSDSFIRRLVGPEVKIGQVRRLRERARMIEMLGAALLYRHDEHAAPTDLAALQKAGYLSPKKDYAGIALEPDGQPRSATYGRLTDFTPLLSVPVQNATPQEADSYKEYRENYTRYWRRYFDPIAMRLDDTGDAGLELTTFILPLLDHSLYNGLKEMLVVDPAHPMRMPVMTPPPPAMISLNLSEKSWREFIYDLLQKRGDDISPLLAHAVNGIGTGVHLAIHDSNPILAFGSGEMLALGADMGNNVNNMIWIQAVVSLLTRPCTAAFELQDIAAVRQLLESGGLGTFYDSVSSYRLEGRDAWVYKIDIEGIVTIRLKVEIAGNYLLVHNIPWTPELSIADDLRATSPAVELTLHPPRATTQFGAMFTAAQERLRAAAFSGMGDLLPFLLNGESVDDAVATHERLLGFAPRHPSGGAWTFDGDTLASTQFGTPAQPRQPGHTEGDTRFGALQNIRDLRVALQFEGTGLRTRIRWHYAKP